MIFDREKFRRRRERMGLTRADVAERARVHAKTIYNLENGHTQPRGFILERIATALGFAVDELLGDVRDDDVASGVGPSASATGSGWASALPPELEAGGRLRTLLDLDDVAGMYRDIGEVRRAVASYTRLLELAPPEGGDPAHERLVTTAHIGLGIARSYLGDLVKALPPLERGLARARAENDRATENVALRQIGVVHYLCGNLRRARAELEQSLALSQRLGDALAETRAHTALTNTIRALGDPTTAEQHGLRALSSAHRLDAPREGARAHVALVFCAVDEGELAAAQEHFEAGLLAMTTLRDRRGEAQAFGAGAVVAHARRDARAAAERVRQSLALARTIQDRHLEGWAIGARAAQRRRAGDDTRALADFSTWKAISREIGDRRGEATASWCIGQIHASRGEHERAVAAMTACVAYEDAMEHPRAAFHRRELQRIERAARNSRPLGQATASPRSRAKSTPPDPVRS